MSEEKLDIQKKNILLMDPADLVIVKKANESLFDERGQWPIDENMVKNIMVYGVLQPTIVRKNGEDKDSNPVYEIVDGRQRTINCREANKRLAKQGSQTHRVPCIVRNDEDKMLMGVMISANELRRGDELITKANKAKRLLEAGQTEEEVAIAFGCTTASIKNYLLLLECDKTVQTAVAKGELSADIAKKMAKLTKAEQKEALEALRKEGATKGKKAKKALERVTGRKVDDGFIGKKEIANLFETMKTTAKATKDDPEAGLAEGIKLLEYVLGKRKTPPFAVVEVSSNTEETEDKPKRGRKAKTEADKPVTKVTASPKKKAKKAKKAKESADDGPSVAAEDGDEEDENTGVDLGDAGEESGEDEGDTAEA